MTKFFAPTFITAISLLLTISTAQAQCFKRLSPLSGGDVIVVPVISPDDKWVAYRSGGGSLERPLELYTVGINGGNLTKVNAPLLSNHNVFSSEFSPDSKHVIYSSKENVDTSDGQCGANDPFGEICARPLNFYSVLRSGGGNAVHLNASAGIEFLDTKSFFHVSSDSQTIYLFNGEEIYSVPMTGGQAVQLASGLSYGRNFVTFTDDEKQILIRSSNLAPNSSFLSSSLFSLDIESKSLTQISEPIVEPARGIYNYVLEPKTKTVYYTGEFQENGNLAMYRVTLSGGDSVRVNENLDLSSRRIFFYPFLDDGNTLYFSIIGSNSQPDALYNINSSSIIANLVVERRVYELKFSADESVAFFSDAFIGGSQISKVTLADPTNIDNLLPDEKPIEDFSLGNWRLSQDGSTIVFVGSGREIFSGQLFSISTDGGEVTTLTKLTDGSVVNNWIFSQNQDSVFYTISPPSEVFVNSSYYKVPVNGGEPTQVDKAVSSPQYLRSHQLTTDERNLVFSARLGDFTTYTYGLFSKQLEGCVDDETMCFPVKVKSGNITQICL